MEQFTDKLSQLPKHESYSHAAKKPQLTCKQPSEVIFDFEFTRLFKRLESRAVILLNVQRFSSWKMLSEIKLKVQLQFNLSVFGLNFSVFNLKIEALFLCLLPYSIV